MKSHNPFLVVLLLLFSLAIKVQAQPSNGHLPQCPDTAPQFVIQAVAASHYKRLVVISAVTIVIVMVVAVAGATGGAAAGATAGYATEKALINEDVEYPGWGGIVGGVAGAITVGSVLGILGGVFGVLVCRCVR